MTRSYVFRTLIIIHEKLLVNHEVKHNKSKSDTLILINEQLSTKPLIINGSQLCTHDLIPVLIFGQQTWHMRRK